MPAQADREVDSLAGPQSAARWQKVRVRRSLVTLTVLAVAAAAILTAKATGVWSRSARRGPVASATAGPEGLDVLPFPGTPDASPSSQIIFPALEPSEVTSITVRGSDSGRHAGRLRALPGGRGTAFVPAKPFLAGERASVVARLSSRAAGTASGVPNATELRFSFTVASPVRVPPPAPPGATKPLPTQSFHSRPDLHPPVVKATSDPDPGSGEVFVTAQHAPQQGPMILDGQGRLVWFRPISDEHITAFDLRVQRYRGRKVLTWWQGRAGKAGVGSDGEDVILDNGYRTVATLHASEGYSSDLHEFQITPQGTALITAFVSVRADLSSVGGPAHGILLDSIVQEIDIRTGRLVWEWHAFGHVPVSASEEGRPQATAPYDYVHVNSVQQLPDGNLLIAARNTWAIYEISRNTGKVIWTLGGKDSNFKIGKGANFYWEHDARLRGNTLTVFDDADRPQKEPQSRALKLDIDPARSKAILARAYTHTPRLLATYEGSMQVLPNGNVFVGWGTEPVSSEYTAGGKPIWDVSFTAPVSSYRAYRFNWSADPTTPPAISVTRGIAGNVTAYASWNGATNVARWQLLGGPSKEGLSPLSTVVSTGFETAITAATAQPYLAVRALDKAGRMLATSPTVSR